MRSILLLSLGMVYSLLSADVVELRDGSRIEGRILSESADGLEVEIGRNETGTIRRVLIIHRSEIRSYIADEKGRVSRPEAMEVTRFSSREFVERLLREAEARVAEKDFDGAIQQFQQAADIAGQEDPSATPEAKVESLEQRAHALRLLQAALQGKIRFLDGRTEGVQASLDEQRIRLEREWAQVQREKEEASRRENTTRRTELGRFNPQASELVERENTLRAQIALLNQRQAEATENLRRIEEEKMRTEAQLKIVQERVKKAESDARTARTELRRRPAPGQR